MCILFLAINQHPNYPLIVAANRDEDYGRPSQSMHHWPDYPHILAGRDGLKGGSWLGVNTLGHFCAVTNFRTGNPANETAISRGELVRRYLDGKETEQQFISHLNTNYSNYNPFNLVLGSLTSIQIFSSIDGSLHGLSDGCHSLSNGSVDEHWPKMSSGVQKLTELVGSNQPIEIDELNKIMHDQTKAEVDDLPHTGVGVEVEKHLSSIFIHGEGYGTRTTTYLLYSENEIDIVEIDYNSDGKVSDQQRFIQKLPSS